MFGVIRSYQELSGVNRHYFAAAGLLSARSSLLALLAKNSTSQRLVHHPLTPIRSTFGRLQGKNSQHAELAKVDQFFIQFSYNFERSDQFPSLSV